jgi:hypothetical protein
VQSGRQLSFDRKALDVFADHAFAQVAIWDDNQNAGENPIKTFGSSVEQGWCRRTAGSMCQRLSQHISDAALRAEWNSFAVSFHSEAKRRGDPKAKERSLSKNPVTLEGLFLRSASILRKQPETLDIQKRQRQSAVLGALGILLFYPLRKKDLLRLRFKRELLRIEGRWHLKLDDASKKNNELLPLRLPSEATPLIDAALVRGDPLYTARECYSESEGQYLLKSPHSEKPYNASAFSRSFSRLIGQPPHLMRTIWCDELVRRGADRSTIQLMLQHRQPLSQQAYEVLADKIRREKSIEALRQIGAQLQ